MEPREQIMEKIVKGYKSLSGDRQKAIYWFTKNLELIKELFKGNQFSEDKINNLIEVAKSREDHFILLLLLYKRQADKDNSQED